MHLLSLFNKIASLPSTVLIFHDSSMNFDIKLRSLKRKLHSPSQSIVSSGLATATTTTTTADESCDTLADDCATQCKKFNSGQGVFKMKSDALTTESSNQETSSSPPPVSSSSSSSPSASQASPSDIISSATTTTALITNSISWQNVPQTKVRQVVFNISMCKLTRYRQTPDPDLFKSVVICNTLKKLQNDLEKEGMKVHFGINDTPIEHNDSESSVTSETAFEITTTTPMTSCLPAILSLDDDVIPSLTSVTPIDTLTETQIDASTVTSQPESTSHTDLPPASEFIVSHHQPDIERLTPHLTSSSLFESCESPSTCTASSPTCTSTSPSPSSSMSSSTTCTIVTDHSSAYLTDQLTSDTSDPLSDDDSVIYASSSVLNEMSRLPAPQQRIDDLFGDIDLSMYDYDILAPLTANTTTTAKITSISAGDLIKCITDEHASMAPCNHSTSSSSATSNSSNCNSTISSATSCATQSASSTSALSASVFSKIFLTKKDSIFLEDLPPAIS